MVLQDFELYDDRGDIACTVWLHFDSGCEPGGSFANRCWKEDAAIRSLIARGLKEIL